MAREVKLADADIGRQKDFAQIDLYRAQANAREAPKPIKREYKAMGGKWYLINEDGKRELVTDDKGNPLSDETFDVQTFQNGDAIVINRRTGETVRKLGNFSKPDKPKDYTEDRAKAAGNRSAALEAIKQADETLARLDPQIKAAKPESYEWSALQSQRAQIVTARNKALADKAEADTLLNTLPKPQAQAQSSGPVTEAAVQAEAARRYPDNPERQRQAVEFWRSKQK